MNKSIEQIKKEFVDNSIVPVVDRVWKELMRRGWAMCSSCGTAYQSIDIQGDNLVIDMTCDCGACDDKITIPISKLIPKVKG